MYLLKVNKPLNIISLLLVIIFFNCQKGNNQKDSSVSRSELPKIAVLLAPSGKGDKSYNDMALSGISYIEKSNMINIVEILPAKVDEYINTIQRFAEDGSDLIIGIGYLYTDAISKVAKQFNDVKFLLIDGQIDNLSNVRSIVFRPQEASFLVGVAAGLVTETDKVGFIAGMDIPIMQTFACGYREGVKYIAKNKNINITVIERFIGSTPDSFTNPARGRDMARLMYQSGIDVIYHAAGASGNGVINAAKETGNFVIGVDTDQSYLAPDFVLTSMIKRIDLAVENAIEDLLNENFSGGIHLMSLQNGGVDYVKSDLVSSSIWDDVEKAKRKLLNGEINACPEDK